MPTFYPAGIFPPQFKNPDNGELASGFKVRAFDAGTTTPTNMFTDKIGTSAGTEVTLNSGGFPEVSGNIVNIWLQSGKEYKLILEDDQSNTEWTLDNQIMALDASDISNLQVASYANLRAITSSLLNDGQVIWVTDEGISGAFRIFTGSVTDDGGTLIVFTDDSSRYAKRLYNGPVNYQWFEPSNDGTTNDSAKFQTALDIGKPVYTGPCNTAINCTINNKVQIFGDGSMASRIKPFNTADAALTYTYTAQQNPIFRFWDYHTEFRGLGFYSASKTGIGFAFSQNVFADYNSNDELATNTKFFGCHFEFLDKGVQFTYGNIGCEFYSCGFANNKYGIYSLDNKFGSIMHAGNKYLYSCELSANDCAIYIHNGTTLGYGAFVLNGVIIEVNEIGIYIYNNSAAMSQASLTLNQVWFEKNGQNRSGGAGSVTVDTWSGSTQGSKSVNSAAMIIEGSGVYVDVYGGGLISHIDMTATDSVVNVRSAFLTEDAGNGGTANSVTNTDTSRIIYQDCMCSDNSIAAQTAGSYVRGIIHRRSHAAADNVDAVSRWWLVDNQTNVIKANPPSLQCSNPGTKVMTTGAGTFSLTGTLVSDGVAYDTCNEFSRASFNFAQYTRFITPESTEQTFSAGFHVLMFTAKITSGDLRFQWWDRGVNPYFGATNIQIPADGEWHTVCALFEATTSTPIYLDAEGKSVAGTTTWRMGQLQIHSFDSIREAAAFLNNPAFVEREITYNTAYDPSNINNGSRQTTTYSIPNANLGDSCKADFSLDLQGIETYAYVDSADSVTVIFSNETGGAVDLAAGTLFIRVNKH